MELEFGYESRGKMLGVTLVTGYLHMGLWAEGRPLPVMTAGIWNKRHSGSEDNVWETANKI